LSVRGGERKLHNEERHDLCCLQNIVCVIRRGSIRFGEGGSYGVHGEEEKCLQKIGGETWKEETDCVGELSLTF
jgi:hypothetical protein